MTKVLRLMKNKPRVFANTLIIKDQKSKFDKSIFTLCDYRENDKCPPGHFNQIK